MVQRVADPRLKIYLYHIPPVAVVGITAGPGFVAGLKSNGLGLFFAGIVVTTVPFIIGLLAGKYIFKLHPAINLGACAGAKAPSCAVSD